MTVNSIFCPIHVIWKTVLIFSVSCHLTKTSTYYDSDLYFFTCRIENYLYYIIFEQFSFQFKLQISTTSQAKSAPLLEYIP